MKGTVLGISNTKFKMNDYGGGYYRYIAFNSEDNERFLVRVTERFYEKELVRFVNFEGIILNPGLRTGDIIIIKNYYDKGYKMDDGTRFIMNPKILEIVDHEKARKAVTYTINEIKFHDWGVVAQNVDSKTVIGKDKFMEMTQIESTWILNKIKDGLTVDETKESGITVVSDFLVYYGWTPDKKFFYSSISTDPTKILERVNLEPIKRVIADKIVQQRMRDFMNMIEKIMSLRFLVQDEDIRRIMRELEMPDSFETCKEMVMNRYWKQDYDIQYFQFLKKYGNPSIAIDGFFFEVGPNMVIFEVPKFARATYLFIGTKTEILSLIRGVMNEKGQWKQKLITYKKEFPEKFKWFSKRVIHTELENWQESIKEAINGEKYEK